MRWSCCCGASPTREHWVTPDTRASKLAPYLAAWKRKVERVGTLNFPSAARNAGLSGSPVVEVEIAADGRLHQATVRRSSGYGALDEAALTILQARQPLRSLPGRHGDRVRTVALCLPMGFRCRRAANRCCDCVVRYGIGTLRARVDAPILASMGNSQIHWPITC